MGDHSTGPPSTDALSRDLSSDEAVSALYSAHYVALVRLATMLLHDQGRAEEIVQDAFVSVHGRYWRLREPDKAVSYLRTAVVNRARSELRHRQVAAKHEPDPPGADASAGSRRSCSCTSAATPGSRRPTSAGRCASWARAGSSSW